MKIIKYAIILSSCLLGVGLVPILIAAAGANAPAPTYHLTTPLGGGDPVITNTVTVTLTPGVATSLIYTDAQGQPTLFDFPAGAVTQTTAITLIPELVTLPRPDFIFGGHAFVLLASRDGQLDKSFKFSAPVTTTVYYSDEDVQSVADENLFRLYWWSGNGWWNAERTCDPVSPYTHDKVNNLISTAICYPAQFGLFATYPVYLPLVVHVAP